MYYIKTLENYYVICKKSTAKTNLVSGKLNKVDPRLYQVILFVVRKNQSSLKIKK